MIHEDIINYNNSKSSEDKAICDKLLESFKNIFPILKIKFGMRILFGLIMATQL